VGALNRNAARGAEAAAAGATATAAEKAPDLSLGARVGFPALGVAVHSVVGVNHAEQPPQERAVRRVRVREGRDPGRGGFREEVREAVLGRVLERARERAQLPEVRVVPVGEERPNPVHGEGAARRENGCKDAAEPKRGDRASRTAVVRAGVHGRRSRHAPVLLILMLRVRLLLLLLLAVPLRVRLGLLRVWVLLTLLLRLVTVRLIGMLLVLLRVMLLLLLIMLLRIVMRVLLLLFLMLLLRGIGRVGFEGVDRVMLLLLGLLRSVGIVAVRLILLLLLLLLIRMLVRCLLLVLLLIVRCVLLARLLLATEVDLVPLVLHGLLLDLLRMRMRPTRCKSPASNWGSLGKVVEKVHLRVRGRHGLRCDRRRDEISGRGGFHRRRSSGRRSGV
jgi:hypothetical protein